MHAAGTRRARAGPNAATRVSLRSLGLSIVIKRYQLRILRLRIVSMSYRVTPLAIKWTKNRLKICQNCPKTVYFLIVRPQEAFCVILNVIELIFY